MRVLCISDLHGRIENIKKLKPLARVDIIVLSGDITHFGGREKAKAALEELFKINKKVFAVPGNCDLPEVNEVLAELDIDLHSSGRVFKEIGFFGVGGSGATPFDTPQEYSEEKLEEFLKQGFEKIKAQKHKILVSHSPPHNTAVDTGGSGAHIGSRKVREFVEKNQVDIVLCGHAHEARGFDWIGRTLVINSGPLHMGCARVRINDKINFEFVSF
ncbi:MAG: metallophosphoesterase [Methanobacteriota archaeon]